jgi:hypothetical protein
MRAIDVQLVGVISGIELSQLILWCRTGAPQQQLARTSTPTIIMTVENRT